MVSDNLHRSGTSMRSSFFTKHRRSFARSGGDRGATVELLRGTKGADFEASGHVRRGGAAVACGCCVGRGGCGKYEDRYVVIKGSFCFVFESEDAPAPSYAIRLHNISVEKDKNPKTVVLRDPVDGIFILSFDSEKKAVDCATVLRAMASLAETEEVRKRLGHGHLLRKRSSVRFAEAVASQKTKDQPDTPVTTGEILSNMEYGTPAGI